MSPELFDLNLDGKNVLPTMASDIWALGCTIFEVSRKLTQYFVLTRKTRLFQSNSLTRGTNTMLGLKGLSQKESPLVVVALVPVTNTALTFGQQSNPVGR